MDDQGRGRADLATVPAVPEPPPTTSTSTSPPASPASAARFLTLQQVAEELNVSHSQVYALVRDRSLTAVKIGGRGQWRVERSRLEEYIDRLYQEAETHDPTDLPDTDPDPDEGRDPAG